MNVTLNKPVRYTVETVVDALKELLKEDMPQEFRNWAIDGITFVDRNPEADVQDFPNNIFHYLRDEPLPEKVRDLVEGILLQGIDQASGAAACNLGSLYYTGSIGEQSYKKAQEYYEIAADYGNEQAIENLGYCHYYGRNGEVNYQKAFEYFSKGAFINRGVSLYKIGDMYKNGYYVKKDEAEAFKIYNRCIDMIPNEDKEIVAEYNADVYVRYADCFLNGIGTEQDVMAALYWAQCAEREFRIRERNYDPFARQGIEWAVELVDKCRDLLDAQHLTLDISC